MRLLRHLIPLALLMLLVTGGTVYAMHLHNNQVHRLTLQSARQEAQAAKVRAQAVLASLKEREAVQNNLDKLAKNCQLGAQAYNQLVLYQRQHLAKPNCAL